MRIIALLIVLTSCSGQLAYADSRPNILFAFADDWGRYASIYGELEPGGANDVIQTPHFDRVAREGVLFRHAFVNAPSCTPCRSSLLSGQHFSRTGRGTILQGGLWSEAIPTYPLIMNDNGYHIGCSAKVWSPGDPRDAPYGGTKYAYNKRGGKFNGFSQFVTSKQDKEAAKQTLFNEVWGNFQDFLKDRQGDEPFCYWWGPTNCHRKWTQGSGKKLWGIDPDDLKGKLPAFLPDVPVIREDFADYLGEAVAFDTGLGVLIEELEKIGELENTIIIVSGDHGAPGFPRGKCNLYDFGVNVSLAIRWGKGIEHPGRVIDDFTSLPDLAPTILDAAGADIPVEMTGRSLLSILKSKTEGLVDSSRDHVVVGRERHVGDARHDFLPYPQRAIRTKDFLYIHNFRPDRWPMGIAPGYGLPEAPFADKETLSNNTFAAFGDLDASPTKAWMLAHRTGEYQPQFDWGFAQRPEFELYDLKADPDQIKNLADDPNYINIKQQLGERLSTRLEELGDPRVLGDGTTFDKHPFTIKIERKPRKKK